MTYRTILQAGGIGDERLRGAERAPAVPSERVRLHSLWKLHFALDRLEARLLGQRVYETGAAETRFSVACFCESVSRALPGAATRAIPKGA
jgi:hypothetical protein